jgi:E3 ubiquitin-protein ligase RNF115/126
MTDSKLDKTLRQCRFSASLPAITIDGRETLYKTSVENGPVECVICMEAMTGQGELSLLPCGHVYHKECISRWEKESKSVRCPQCRRKN